MHARSTLMYAVRYAMHAQFFLTDNVALSLEVCGPAGKPTIVDFVSTSMSSRVETDQRLNKAITVPTSGW